MSDVQILRATGTPTAKTFTIPGAVELRIKAIYAEFRNTGAAFNWTPVVEFISDSGDTIAIAVDPSTVVTAGDDADVSWFPGLKGGAGSAAPGAVDYLLLTGAGQTVIRPPIGDSDHAKFVYATRQTNNDAS